MPTIKYFPFMGPNRRSDKPVVEITLDFDPADQHRFPRYTAETRELLIKGGVLTTEDTFPEHPLPDGPFACYASVLLQTALLFQRKAGHRVSFFSVLPTRDQNEYIALVEHEHCDVGMTAVKLAYELVAGQRSELAEPFRMFSKFARDRALPAETEAIIKAADRRDIPCIHLERQPFKREDFNELTGGLCSRRNGLLMLGHGGFQHVLDGTYCIDKSEDFKDLLKEQDQHGPLREASNPDSHFSDSSAEKLLDWLFPAKAPARMPIIAITGTNGKTTTTRMISHVMSVAGRKPGMVCTDGIFLNDSLLEKGDKSTRTGHLKVLTSKAVDVAVLETHHSGILRRGFAFRWCDIAVCLNVTEDHLGLLDIDTVEQMANVKQALVERARYAVVLNADDPHCLAMLESVTAEKTCLVSMENNLGDLSAHVGKRSSCFCILELLEGEEWLVIHDEGKRLPVMAAARIPATFDGTARFNVSNAMHAMAASYLAGTDIETIRAAMGAFKAAYESTPGRLNVFDDLPFRIIMDFAHNPDGMRKLCEFVGQQKVSGRKLIVFSGSVDRTDEALKKISRSLAGHFDFYFCKEFVPKNDVKRRKVAHILQQGLIEAGVAESQTKVTTNGKKVIFEIFDACQAGDLLVILMGHVETPFLPVYIREYADSLAGG